MRVVEDGEPAVVDGVGGLVEDEVEAIAAPLPVEEAVDGRVAQEGAATARDRHEHRRPAVAIAQALAAEAEELKVLVVWLGSR